MACALVLVALITSATAGTDEGAPRRWLIRRTPAGTPRWLIRKAPAGTDKVAPRRLRGTDEVIDKVPPRRLAKKKKDSKGTAESKLDQEAKALPSKAAEGSVFRVGMIVIHLQGKYAGKKSVVVKKFDTGTFARPFHHALVAGIEDFTTRPTQEADIEKRRRQIRSMTFVKYVSYSHIMPTRYNVPATIDVSNIVTEEQMDTPEGRVEGKEAFKKLILEKWRELLYLVTKLKIEIGLNW